MPSFETVGDKKIGKTGSRIIYGVGQEKRRMNGESEGEKILK